MRYLVLATLLLSPLLSFAQSSGGCMPLPAPGIPMSHAREIVYSRVDGPNGSIWVNDGQGIDYQLFGNGQIPKLSGNGWHLLYMRNTSPASPFQGREWVRHDFNTSVHGGTDTVLLSSNNDELIGYDFRDADSSIVKSHYSCLNYGSFSFRSVVDICSDTYDDGPDVRQSDGLIAYHNVLLGPATVRPDGTQRTFIPNLTDFDVWPTWSPDGQWLLFGRSSTFYSQVSAYPFHVHNYYKIRPDGTDLTPLTYFPTTDSARFVGGGAWSPDGQAVIIGGTVNGRHGLWALRPDGSGQLDSIPTTPGPRINFVGSGAPHVFTPVGLREAATTRGASLYPNPAATLASLRFDRPVAAGFVVELLDPLGRLVGRYAMAAGTWQVTIPLDGLSAGVYACRWHAAGEGGTRLLRIEP